MTTLRARIEALCKEGPKTTKELTALLDETPEAIWQACYHLRRRGRLAGVKKGRSFTYTTPAIDERLALYIAVLALEWLTDYLMTQNDGGSQWEREKALGELREWSEINQAQAAQLPHVVGNLLAAAFSGASTQAAQSTLFLLKRVEELISKVEVIHNEINNLKTVNNDLLDRIAEQDGSIQALRKEIGELRIERREAAAHLQKQITELKER